MKGIAKIILLLHCYGIDFALIKRLDIIQGQALFRRVIQLLTLGDWCQ